MNNEIIYKSADILQCEKMVKAFNEYQIEEFKYDSMVRVLYFSETDKYFPVVWFGHVFDSGQRLQNDFESLDFNNKYNANDLVIAVDEDIAYEYEEESYSDLLLLFDAIMKTYHDCVMITVQDGNAKNETEIKLEQMRQDIFSNVFGQSAPLS